MDKGLLVASKETVVLRQWGEETNSWFYQQVDKVIWTTKRDSSADVSSVGPSIRSEERPTLETSVLESLYSDQIILSTTVIKPNIR